MATREGRKRRKADRQSTAIGAIPSFRHLENPFTPQSIWSDDRVAAIHDAALTVLEELGVKVLLPEARDIYAAGGALVARQDVRIGRDMIAAALAAAPGSFELQGGAPDRAQMFGPGAMMFGAGAGCPNVFDRERGRRPGSLRDFEETIRLQQAFDAIHKLSPSAEPQDRPIHLRHYDTTRIQLALSDKPLFLYARGRGQIADGFEMVRLARGLSREAFETAPYVTTVINTNSPRQIDRPMAQGIIDFARAGQMATITPFCLMGAMAPVTVAGALTLQHAEALAGITLAQLVRPGAPVVYGAFASNVDLKSGAPAFGGPAQIQAAIGSGQLARHIGLPWRSAAGSAGTAADGQGAQENAMALWGAVMGGATVTFHAAGWLEGGLSFGYEKFIVDMEAVHTIAALAAGTPDDDAAIGLDALREVAPGGHFFGAAHTMERYETAFLPPLVADLSNHGAWMEAGAMTAEQRATGIWKQVLAEFEPPASTAGAEDAVAAFIERRTAEGGAPPLD